MTKVFTLTIVPATRRSRELFVLSVAPAVPQEMAARQVMNLGELAGHRGADVLILKDCEVAVAPVGLAGLLFRWRSWRQARKAGAK